MDGQVFGLCSIAVSVRGREFHEVMMPTVTFPLWGSLGSFKVVSTMSTG
jgi:hypothetical protein